MKLFRTLLSVVLMVIALSAGIAHADEEAQLTCGTWKVWSYSEKASFLAGWVQATNTARSVARMYEDEQILSELEFLLWPQGYQIGSIIVEMDVECRNWEDRDQTLIESMLNISRKINICPDHSARVTVWPKPKPETKEKE